MESYGRLWKVTIKMLLLAVFILLSATIVMPLVSERAFDSAEKLVSAYKWRKAEAEFREAIRIDPFNSKYLAKYGEFLLLQARYLDYKEPVLKEAERFLKKAIEIDQCNAQDYLILGQVELQKGSLEEALANFRKASDRDPNGFSVAYSIGLSSLGFLKIMDACDRAFVLGRLKHAISMIPMSADEVYLSVWRATKNFGFLQAITSENLKGQKRLYDFLITNDLWQFRRGQALQVEHYLKREDPDMSRASELEKTKRLKEFTDKRKMAGASIGMPNDVVSAGDWSGKAFDQKSEYKDGNMYWSGTMYAFIDMPQGDALIRIQAKAQRARSIYPYMIVEMDGREVGETFVDSEDWKNYDFSVSGNGGVKILSVTFANDWNDPASGEDRNLFVGKAEAVKIEG